MIQHAKKYQSIGFLIRKLRTRIDTFRFRMNELNQIRKTGVKVDYDIRKNPKVVKIIVKGKPIEFELSHDYPRWKNMPKSSVPVVRDFVVVGDVKLPSTVSTLREALEYLNE